MELGSFWGYYSLWLRRAIPEASLVLVEPDPAYLEVGQRNAELNGTPARFVQTAVGQPDGAVIDFLCESDGMTRPVPAMSVDAPPQHLRRPLTHQRCLDALSSAGAHVIAEHTVSESFSGDGLIVASLDPRDRDLQIPLSRARASDSLFGGL